MNIQAASDTLGGVDSDTRTTNKTLARRVLEEIFPANDVNALRQVISDDFVNHEAPAGTPPGLGAITMFMNLLDEAFSEQRWDIHDVLTEDDKVVIRCTHAGILRRLHGEGPGFSGVCALVVIGQRPIDHENEAKNLDHEKYAGHGGPICLVATTRAKRAGRGAVI